MTAPIGTTDVNAIIDENGRSATLRRATPTLDSEGKTIAYTNTDTAVTVVMMDLSNREYEAVVAGRLIKSERKAVFKASVDVQQADFLIITSGSEEYEIVALRIPEDFGALVYKTGFLKRSV